MGNYRSSDLRELSDQIAAWRRARGVTQSRLESMAGLAHNALSRIENKQVSPRLATVERIAAALGVSVEELQFRRPENSATEIRENSAEYLVRRLDELDGDGRESVLKAFHALLDQITNEK